MTTSDPPAFATTSDLQLAVAQLDNKLSQTQLQLENRILQSELRTREALDNWSRWILGGIFGLYALNIGLLAGVIYFGLSLLRQSS